MSRWLRLSVGLALCLNCQLCNFRVEAKEVQMNLDAYRSALTNRIKNHWSHPSSPGCGSYPVVFFEIRDDGKVHQLRLLRSTGAAKIDHSAIQAVQDAQPFESLPTEVKAVRFVVTFADYGPIVDRAFIRRER